MARKSRIFTKPAESVPGDRVWNTALYVRLSVLDGGKPGRGKPDRDKPGGDKPDRNKPIGKKSDGDTVKNQQAVLRNFIEGKSCFSLHSVYVDNGRSGVNFKRGEFERLMGDIKGGLVDCIIVKDLSRLGRSYIETGEYLEQIFPLLGVRVIAVNDGYDSSAPGSADSLSVHLKNLVNDIYARDISRKICPVLRVKQERGEFIGTFAPYGYKKAETDRHRLVPDPETAPVVRDIFRWRLEGQTCGEIVQRLQEEGIPSPSQYRYETGIIRDERLGAAVWKTTTVSRILTRQVYLGHMVQGKRRASLWEGKKQTEQPVKRWLVVEGTHDPLVDEDTFYLVQSL